MREKRRRCTAKEITAGARVMDEVKAVATPPLNESEFLELAINLFRNGGVGEAYALAAPRHCREGERSGRKLAQGRGKLVGKLGEGLRGSIALASDLASDSAKVSNTSELVPARVR